MSNKKRLNTFCFFFCMGYILFSEEIIGKYSDFPFSEIEFMSNSRISILTRDLMADTEKESSGDYIIKTENSVPFITITWDNKEQEKFLMLSNELLCYFYKKDTYPDISGVGVNDGAMRGERIFNRPDKITASSYLVEKDISHSPQNTNSEIGKAWVEGVAGQGIHEKLFITQRDTIALYVSIGFVSYSNPRLYTENSRPKKIKVSVQDKFLFEADLSDTPNFQKISLPQKLTKGDVMVLEILEVYPGTKYEDTCINSIFYDTL